MTKRIFHIIIGCMALGLLASCSGTENKRPRPDLRETYAKNDQIPFGGYVAYHQLENMFSRNDVRTKNQPFDNTWSQLSDTGSLYVCISKFVFLSDEEAKAMLDYVYAGNTLFISANYIDTSLLNQVKCKENFNEFFYGLNWNIDTMMQTGAKTRDSLYSYFYYPFQNNFIVKDTVYTKVLGHDEHMNTNFLVYFHGKGKLFLHCEPKAFSNYFLLKDDNYKYLQNAMAYTNLSPDHLYWDDYYRRFTARRGSRGALGEILSHPPLAAAFYLILALMILYALFASKRKQRIVEQIKPNVNTTLAFTETIGRLYLQKKDNRNIAEKMITYFNEHVRNTYFLNTNVVDEEFITTLSRKSGVQQERVESLYRAITHVYQSVQVDDYQLLSLNEQIQKFYSK
ncbi:MAG: DUF4350 domain-containing protein [Bacteroidetes bacterium]|nr:DUF4350 domain-containing protein [Bacteroidota bacterium]